MAKKTKLRRGFVKEAEELALEYRLELGLKACDALCVHKLANHLCIPIFCLNDHPAISDEVKAHWSGPNSKFSGITISDGSYKEVIHNDNHHRRRQLSTIAHELAHVILDHDLSAPIKHDGERDYNAEIEEEAKRLSTTLLLPREATFYIAKNKLTIEQVDEIYGVSESLLKYRMRITDANRRLRNYSSKTRQ